MNPSAAMPLALLLAAALAAPLPPASIALPQEGASVRALEAGAPRLDPKTGRWPAPAERFPIERVVDGDTLWITRAGQREKLRLLAVDTEERLLGSPNASATKPETVFGEECALWAQGFFDELGEDGRPPEIGLAFPGGVEQRDVYGRLLCHVLLADGTDYNLLLVREGKSPYFNKYGNSELCHAAFVDAQAEARAAERGIWSPDANRPATPGAPAARRPYERLLPWWDLRAEAVERFRARRGEDPTRWIAADDPGALADALPRGEEMQVFGLVERLFDEDDGSLTVLLSSGDKQNAVRAIVPAAARAALVESFDPTATTAEFRQNYLYVTGTLRHGARGYELDGGDPARWRVADPEQ